MQRWPLEYFHESGGKFRSLDGSRRHPFDRQQVTDARRRGRHALPVAARQANRSHWTNIRFFRYFILANRKCARDDWSGALVTGVSGEMKVLFFH
jgi:hypothetical protein